MADFGKLNFAVSFNPQTAFPLDARYYFSSLSAAEAAAATAVEVGSSDGTYFYGENVCVVTESSADLYIIQPDKTLKAVGSAVLGDGKSIEIVDGKVALKGFGSATAGQQPRINAAGTAIEWYTPDTSFDRLCDVQNRISLEIHQGYVGKKVRVLVDGRDKDMLTARTEGGRLVRFAGDDSLIGQFMDVKITGCTTWSLIGEI